MISLPHWALGEYDVLNPSVYCMWPILVGCLHEHWSHQTKWDTSGLNLASLPQISLAPTVLHQMCRGSSAAHCLTPSQPVSSLRATTHNSSPGSPLMSHGLLLRGRGQCRPHPTHTRANPHTVTIVPVEEGMMDNNLRIDIKLYNNGEFSLQALPLLTHSRSLPLDSFCGVL